ncbi:MAG: tetratricopeptide repeat protein [Candidatus Eisenbacteria bacterium]
MTSTFPHDGDSRRPTGEVDAHARPTPRRSFADGAVVANRYRIDAYLDQGGMGQVYRAHDLDLDVPLALKTIQPEIASDPTALRRFKQEILLARSVSHPNVCRIFDLWRDEPSDVSFLTMELLAGHTLASRIRSGGAIPTSSALPLVRQMANALQAAHRAGVVHRDFKSANVMLVPAGSGERAVITDFGLAVTVKDQRSDEQARPLGPAGSDREHGPSAIGTEETHVLDSLGAESTATIDMSASAPRPGAQSPPPPEPRPRHAIVGTPAYMSPEQVTGGAIGPASDLYALGVVLFEMVTGQLPFSGPTPIETAREHVTSQPPNPSALVDVDAHWEETILRLLSKDPAARPASAEDVVLALEGREEPTQMVRYALPPERDTFVGRREDIDAIVARLEAGDEATDRVGAHVQIDAGVDGEIPGAAATRLLTLQGTGGTGKTRLALRYAWESLSRWPGGVWFCDLSEVRTADGIAAAIASALGVSLDQRNPVAHLGGVLAGRRKSLFILDNFEQLVEHADATLGQWLESGGAARFLVTSQERLRLPDEAAYALSPLDPGTQGVELFAIRAASHRPGFEVDESNRTRVDEIVRRLDGLPLAIELAASRLRMLSLEQLHERLEDRFRILSGGKKGRHQALRATLDWSWELLRPFEQSAMAQISTLEGGFTLEAAEAVVDLSMYDEDPFVLDVIQSLVDKSWLRADVAQGELRFHTYASVQEYAAERAREYAAREGGARENSAQGGGSGGGSVSGDAQSPAQAEARHGDYFARMSARLLEGIHGPGGTAIQATLLLERDNLIAACRRATLRRDAGVAEATFHAVDAVLAVRGPFGASAELARGVVELLERLESGRILVCLGNAERRLGNVDSARVVYETALGIARETANPRLEATLTSHAAILAASQGRVTDAMEGMKASLELARRNGDRILEGNNLGNLGVLYATQGKLDEAFSHYEAALAAHHATGHREGESTVLSALSNLLIDQSRFDDARERCSAALAISRDMRDEVQGGYALSALALVDRIQGHMEAALEHGLAALDVARRSGERRFEGYLLGDLAVLHHTEGRASEARACFEEALSITREVRNRGGEAAVRAGYARFLVDERQLDEAEVQAEASLTVHRELGDRTAEGSDLRTLGEIDRMRGRADEARTRFTESEAILRESDDRIELGLTLCARGELDAGNGRGDAPGGANAEKQCADPARTDLAESRLDAARAALAEAEAIAKDLSLMPAAELVRRIERLRETIAAVTREQ